MKNKYTIISAVFIVMLSWLFTIIINWNSINNPIEQRAADTIGYEPFEVVKLEKGCICFSHGTGSIDTGVLFLTYLENDLFGANNLDIKGNIGERYNHFINNKDLSKYFVFNLEIFSNKIIYYSCCETKLARPVIVNGKDIELHNVEFEWNDKSYNLTFWFFMAPKGDLPKVEFK